MKIPVYPANCLECVMCRSVFNPFTAFLSGEEEYGEDWYYMSQGHTGLCIKCDLSDYQWDDDYYSPKLYEEELGTGIFEPLNRRPRRKRPQHGWEFMLDEWGEPTQDGYH